MLQLFSLEFMFRLIEEIDKGISRRNYVKDSYRAYWNGFNTTPDVRPNGRCNSRFHLLFWKWIWTVRTTADSDSPFWWHCNVCECPVEGSEQTRSGDPWYERA